MSANKNLHTNPETNLYEPTDNIYHATGNARAAKRSPLVLSGAAAAIASIVLAGSLILGAPAKAPAPQPGQEPAAKDWAGARRVDGGELVFGGLAPATSYDVWGRMAEDDQWMEVREIR